MNTAYRWLGAVAAAMVPSNWAVRLALAGAALVVVALGLGAATTNAAGPVGAVYAASNAADGNTISIFHRFPDGHLEPAGSVATGGLGSGPDTTRPELADDPLGSQNSLIGDQANGLLFVVNAGSDTVSAFRIGSTGDLVRTAIADVGSFPVSLAYQDDTLYVLNAKGNSLTGFAVLPDGALRELDTCLLPPLPGSPDGLITQTAGQVGFSPDGGRLVVVSKEGPTGNNFPRETLGSGRIHVYRVDAEGRLENCASPTTTVLSANSDGGGKFPFDFAWDEKGHLLLTEVFGASTSLTGSAVSSFALAKDGTLSPISEVASGEGVACWIVRSGGNVFVANYVGDPSTFGGSISSYAVASNGRLTLTDAAAGTFDGTPPHFATDLAVSRDGEFLYQLTPGSGAIRPFAVDRASGGLTRLPALEGVFDHGAAGIAAVDFER